MSAAPAATEGPIAVINPRQVWDFAKAEGQLTMTDGLEAQFLACLPRSSS